MSQQQSEDELEERVEHLEKRLEALIRKINYHIEEGHDEC